MNLFNGIIKATLVLVCLVIVAGCRKSVHDAQSPENSSFKKVVCVICIDGSKSYKYLDQAKKTVAGILASLPPGSKIYIRWIADDSVKDSFSILSTVLPEKGKKGSPFDVKNKKNQDIIKAKDVKIRKSAIKIILQAVSPKSNRTDIFGAVYAAGERFKISADRVPLLVLLTDMEDDAGKEKTYDIALNGASVKIMAFQTGKNDITIKKNWSEYLSGHGASKVEFLPMDEPFALGDIQ